MDLQFFDFNGLTDNERCHLTSILRSDVNTEALKLPWNTTEEDNNINVLVTETPTDIQTTWYNAVAHPYQQQMMTTMCNDWQGPTMYNVATNGHITPYLHGVAYPHPEYNMSTEIHEVNYGRDNSRRNNRGKNMRRDNYNRAINSVNEIQHGYVGDQGQYHPQIPIMYIYPEHHAISAQQHPVAGQIYYSPAIYSSATLQPHPYAHPTYPSHHQSQENRFVRQSQSISPQSNQEEVKPTTTKSHNRCAVSICAPTEVDCQQSNQDDKKSAQIDTVITITVNNNESKLRTENADESTANRETVTTNGEVPSVNKTEHNKSVGNDDCQIGEKNEMPSTNINNRHNRKTTNNSIETEQNGETDKNEIVKTVSEPLSKENETTSQIKENKHRLKDNGDQKTVINTSNSSIASSDSSPVPASKTSPAMKPKRTWASLLKNNNNIESIAKPSSTSNITASVDPVHNGLPKMIQKEPLTSPVANSTISNQNASFNTPTTAATDYKILQNGVLENFYDDPNLFRMGEFLLRYQMDKQTVSLLPRGLTNRSNYCYINSILQALLACPLFYNLLKALPHPNKYEQLNKHSTTPLIDNMVRFVREFTPLSETARLPRKDRVYKRAADTTIENGVALEPSYVHTMLKYTPAASVFSVEGRQEDAEEFLSCLLNGINDEMLDLMKLVNNEKNTVANMENSINNSHDEEEWKVIGPKNKGSVTRCTELERTPLSDIFRGQLRSRVSRAGEQPTDNVQPFFTLQLDIEKADSVKHALELLVGKDQLEGMTCSKTKKQIEAWKQVTLEELPVILILHLKWFVYKSNGCSKILKSVEFPVDLKIDGKFLSPNAVKKLSPKQKQYKLFAVTYHDGKEASKGHYITDAFHVGYGGWVRYDDSSAKGVSELNVLRPAPPRVPYLLYYRRCDTIGNCQSNNGRSR